MRARSTAPCEDAAMNKLGMIAIVVGAVLGGCGGAQKGSAKDACGAAAANIGDIFKREVAGEGEGMAQMVPELQQLFADHCVADKWSPEAIACMQKAGDHAALEACEPTITKAQQDALKADVEAKMNAAQGGKEDMMMQAPGGGDAEGGSGGGGGGEGDGADPCGGGE